LYKQALARWYAVWSRESFGLDLRSLAALRIGYGAIILCDLLVRGSTLEAHYTDLGVFPLETFHSTGLPTGISFHAISGSLWFQAFLFFLNALAASALLFGWRTRVATIVCWAFMFSLHNRNFLVLNGGDTWMRLTLLWAIFLPWGEMWSLDAKRTTPRQEPYVLSGATFGLVIQVFLVYWLAGIFKYGPAWWVEGSATHLSMALTEWNGEWAYYLLYFPTLMKGLTFSVLVYELIAPFLLFFPIWTQKIRTFVVLGFAGFHVGLAMFIEIGFFPYIGMVSVISLLPGWFWDNRLVQKATSQITRFWKGIPFSWPATARRRPLKLRPLTNWMLIGMTLYICYWNAGTWNPKWGPPPEVQIPGYVVHIDQYWGLFAPEPPRVHSWYLAVAERKSGQKVDLLRGGEPVDWDVPSSSGVYPNQRWKRYYVGQSADFGSFTREPFIRYLYRRWSTRFPDIVSIELLRLYQPTNLNFEDEPPGKVSLLKKYRHEI
jgi:HTTM domain